MSTDLRVSIEGIGAWAPGLADWHGLRGYLRGTSERDADTPDRPPATVLPTSERRRVPASVLQAIEVATQAVTMAGRDPAGLPCVFASAHGDAGIVDYMCAVLAHTPSDLSPTRFHNSVHNAAAGYWTIANGSHSASSAVCGLEFSFAAGLLEAAVQVCADQRAVLLVVSDMPGVGPLREVIASSEAFACALLLEPQPTANTLASCGIVLQGAAPATPTAHPGPAALAAANVAARGLPLLQAIAGEAASVIILPAAAKLSLALHVEMTA